MSAITRSLYVKQYTLQQKFSSVGLCEEMTIGDVVEVRSRRLGLQRGNSVGRAVVLSKGQACRGVLPNEDFCPTRNAGDWDADVVGVGRTVLTDTVKRRGCYLELYPLWHRKPMKHVAKSQRDVFVSANTNDQTGGSVQDHVKSTDDL